MTDGSQMSLDEYSIGGLIPITYCEHQLFIRVFTGHYAPGLPSCLGSLLTTVLIVLANGNQVHLDYLRDHPVRVRRDRGDAVLLH